MSRWENPLLVGSAGQLYNHATVPGEKGR
jgi:hypothetical protein